MKRGIQIFENTVSEQQGTVQADVTKRFEGESSGSTITINENRHKLLERTKYRHVSPQRVSSNMLPSAAPATEVNGIDTLIQCDRILASAEPSLWKVLKVPTASLLEDAERVIVGNLNSRERKKEVESLYEKLEGLASTSSTQQCKASIGQRSATIEKAAQNLVIVTKLQLSLESTLKDLFLLKKCTTDVESVVNATKTVSMKEARAVEQDLGQMEKQFDVLESAMKEHIDNIFAKLSSTNSELDTLAQKFSS